MSPAAPNDSLEAVVAWLEEQGLIRVPGWETKPDRIVFAGSCFPLLASGQRLRKRPGPDELHVVRGLPMIEFDGEHWSVNDLRETQVAAKFSGLSDAAQELKRRIESSTRTVPESDP